MKYISLLRGINVSGQKKILMKDLKALYENLGFENVVTYIQSGNVLFETKETTVKALEHKITAAIQKAYGFEVPILVKTTADLQKIFEGNKYVALYGDVITKLYFTLLGETPKMEFVNVLMALDYSSEEFYIDNNTVYFYCPTGYGRTKLNNNFFEKKLKVAATTRNYKTIRKLLELAAEKLD